MKPFRQSRHNKGFTLIELLIIAALISLLAGIAVVNVMDVKEQTERKASYSDAKQLADSISRAHFDTGMYIALGYLPFTELILQDMGKADTATLLPPNFLATGHPNTVLQGPLQRRIHDGWRGGYCYEFGVRGQISTGEDYLCKMKMPDGTADPDKLLPWPADPWGNPYVIYLLDIRDKDPPVAWLAKPTWIANYKALLVSYGKNGIPGGPADPKKSALLEPQGKTLRLYKGEVGDPYFTALKIGEIKIETHLKALSIAPPFAFSAYGTDPDTGEKYAGILDPGSDDIVMRIP